MLQKTTTTTSRTFGFRAAKSAPKNQLLYPFKKDMCEMIKNLEFEQVQIDFQKKRSEDLKAIKQSKKIFVPADKTRNLYEIEPDEFTKMLKDNVTKTFRKSNAETVAVVNSEACTIRDKLSISGRVFLLMKHS